MRLPYVQHIQGILNISLVILWKNMLVTIIEKNLNRKFFFFSYVKYAYTVSRRIMNRKLQKLCRFWRKTSSTIIPRTTNFQTTQLAASEFWSEQKEASVLNRYNYDDFFKFALRCYPSVRLLKKWFYVGLISRKKVKSKLKNILILAVYASN